MANLGLDKKEKEAPPPDLADGYAERKKRRDEENLENLLQNIIEDKKSGEYRLPHHIDLKTGIYNGKQILEPKKLIIIACPTK